MNDLMLDTEKMFIKECRAVALILKCSEETEMGERLDRLLKIMQERAMQSLVSEGQLMERLTTMTEERDRLREQINLLGWKLNNNGKITSKDWMDIVASQALNNTPEQSDE